MSDTANNKLVERTESDNEYVSSESAESQDNTQVERESLKEPKTSNKSSDEPNYKERQINAWVKKINNGEKDLEDIENNPSLHWLKEEVTNKLGINPSNDTQDLEQVFDKIQEKKAHQKNLEKLEGLPTSIYNEIVKEVNERVEDGALQAKALQRVLSRRKKDIANIGKIKEVNQIKMKVPSGKSSVNKIEFTQEELSKLNQSDYNRIMDMVDDGKAFVK